MSKKVTITAVSGPGKGWKFSSGELSVCIIGRADDCNIVIEDEDISQHHCIIEINPPIVTVEDLKSKNGTLLNSNDISELEEPSLLKDGDTISIGSTIFSIQVEGFIPVYISASEKTEEEEKEETLSSLINDLKSKKSVQAVEQVKEIAGYKIVSELEEGVAGAVYVAEDEESGQQVILKTMLPAIPVEVEHKAGFIREAKSLEMLSHKNIVTVLGSGVSNGLFYFTSEYCNHGNLEEFVNNSNEPITYQAAVQIILDVLNGLDYLHNIEIPGLQPAGGGVDTPKGLVHRDIKPENILFDMTSNGKVAKIADFGLSTVFNLAGLRRLTQPCSKGDNMDFICRQQIVDYKYAKPEVDIWSTVALLYFILAGRPPRPLYKIKHPLCALLETDPVSIGKRRPELPSGLIEIIDFALNDKGDLAYKTAGSLREDLIRYKD